MLALQASEKDSGALIRGSGLDLPVFCHIMVAFWAIHSGSRHGRCGLGGVLDKDDLVSWSVLDVLLKHVCFFGAVVLPAISTLTAI